MGDFDPATSGGFWVAIRVSGRSGFFRTHSTSVCLIGNPGSLGKSIAVRPEKSQENFTMYNFSFTMWKKCRAGSIVISPPWSDVSRFSLNFANDSDKLDGSGFAATAFSHVIPDPDKKMDRFRGGAIPGGRK